MLSWRR